MSRFINSKLKSLSPYVPGEQPKERKYVKLNTNESPYKPSYMAIKLAKKQLNKVMLYSDPECKDLTNALANYLGVLPSQVILTNGSDEVLNFAFTAYCSDKKPAIFADVTYGFYKVFASVNGVPYKEIPLKSDFSLSVDDYLDEDGVIFIANPNAPTGLSISLSDIEKLLQKNADRLVVVDEAYVDFGGESAVKLVDKYDNLLVTQTFSKSRSMAGARLGFGVANEKIIKDLNTVKYSTNPYNVNRVTQAMGIGAILDDKYFRKNCENIIKNREFTVTSLKKLGFEVTDSKTNFVFAKNLKISGESLYKQLKQRGILVRHFNTERLKDYVRITIGSEKEMKTFIKEVASILGE